MGVVELCAEILPEARQEGERLLVGQLETLERAAGGVEVALHVERGVDREAVGQQVQRVAQLAPGGEHARALDVALDVLVEHRSRQQCALGEVPLRAEVEVGGAERFQQGVAEVDREGAVVVHERGRATADAGREVQQRRAGHGLGRAEAQHDLVGQVPGHVQRRKHVLVAVVDFSAYRVAVARRGGGACHAEEGLAVVGPVGRIGCRARRPAGGADLGIDHAHADVAAEGAIQQFGVEVQLQIGTQAPLVDLEVVVGRAEVADAGQPVVAAGQAVVAVAIDVQQLGDLAEIRDQPAAGRTGQAAAEAIQGGAQVAHGHPGGQPLRGAAVADVAVLLRTHVVVLVGQAATQGEGRVDDELQVDLGGVEAVVHEARIEADLADVGPHWRAGAGGRHGAIAQPGPGRGIVEREREGHARDVGIAAHVQHEAVQVGVVEADQREHRALVVGGGVAQLRVQPHRVVDVVFQRQAVLLELGRLLDVGRLGAEVDVVEHPVDQAALAVDFGFADRDLGLAAEAGVAVQVGAQRILALVLGQLRVHRVEADQGVIGGAPLQGAGQAGALDLAGGPDVARVARHPGVGGGLVGGDVGGGIGRTRGVVPAVGCVDSVGGVGA